MPFGPTYSATGANDIPLGIPARMLPVDSIITTGPTQATSGSVTKSLEASESLVEHSVKRKADELADVRIKFLRPV